MINASELEGLAVDLARAGTVAPAKVRPIVSRGALNIKRRMQSDASASSSFKAIAGTIDYDITVGFDGVEAEIGPNRALGGAASLAGIAYFGSSKPGGATVPDPVLALEEEAPRFVQNLAEAVGFVF
jgi:hypothetical protein